MGVPRPPPSSPLSPKGEHSFVHRLRERLASVPGASTTASSLSLGKDNDCFWRELAGRETGDSNGSCWRWVSCGNKLGPGLCHATAHLAAYRRWQFRRVDPIDAQLTERLSQTPRLIGGWLSHERSLSLSHPLPPTPTPTPAASCFPHSECTTTLGGQASPPSN